MTDTGLTPKARALVAELKNADAYGLDAKDFRLPSLPESDTASLTTEAAADAELQLSQAALKYARFARGGRISDPAAQLNTNLDRRPQWIDPKIILDNWRHQTRRTPYCAVCTPSTRNLKSYASCTSRPCRKPDAADECRR